MSYILLVEDNQDNADLVIRALQAAGFQVQHTTRGLTAAGMVRKEQPDLILMDFDLPEVVHWLSEAGGVYGHQGGWRHARYLTAGGGACGTLSAHRTGRAIGRTEPCQDHRFALHRFVRFAMNGSTLP